MIQTIQYTTIKSKNNKEIQVPAPQILQFQGPEIQVQISSPLKIVEANDKKHIVTPSKIVSALIDTGASNTIISDKLASFLKLPQTGFTKITSVQDQQTRPVYSARIIFHWGTILELAIASCPLQNFDCLIGRDVLRNWNITYNGAAGIFIICE